VWRAAGAVAVHTAAGGEARVVALSYGERGESGELWKEPGQTTENVKRIRHKEAETAAAAVGAELVAFDLGDYPLTVDDEAIGRRTELIREYAPHVILTHPERDPFNPDHPEAHRATLRARLLATGAVVASAFKTAPPSELLVFEPHQPDLCGFVPTTFLDITPVIEAKHEAMGAMAAQRYLQQYYAQRAEPASRPAARTATARSTPSWRR
jgi:4-oxalomesaconate hydratase